MVEGFMHLSSALQWQSVVHEREANLQLQLPLDLNCSHMQQVSECVEEQKKINRTWGQGCCQPFSSQTWINSSAAVPFDLLLSMSSLVDGHV